MLSKKATKIDGIFTVDLMLCNVCFIKICSKFSSVLLLCLLQIFMKQTLVNVKSTVKILSIFEAFSENMNFNSAANACFFL